MDIDDIIKLNIEIEGLLRVLKSRECPEARGLLLEKTDIFSALIYEKFPIFEPESSDDATNLDDASTASLPITNAFANDSESTSEPTPAPAPEPTSASESEPEPTDAETSIVVTLDAPSAPETKVQPEPLADAQMRIDQMISCREAKNLSRAFTINDKFRFVRELFGNDQNKFIETIELVTKMPSLDVAYDYFLNELCWDADQDNVADFLTVIANHFNETK